MTRLNAKGEYSVARNKQNLWVHEWNRGGDTGRVTRVGSLARQGRHVSVGQGTRQGSCTMELAAARLGVLGC